jgi:uncharacterized membrane protein
MSPSIQAGLTQTIARPVEQAAPARRARIESVEVVRGVIMILMAIDHTRDFFGNSGFNPTDPATTTIPLFFTRWITHFCAPTFFFLTGTGAFLARRRKTTSELSRFLVTRGVWLIFLELVVCRGFGWQFNFDFHLVFLIVLWALGWSMITLSALVYLPAWAVATFGAAMIACHNLLDSVSSTGAVWSILHVPGLLVDTPHFTLAESYPLIPWVGVTAAGYGLGQIYSWPAERRRKFLLRLGLGAIVGFIVLRFINVYGDPAPWSVQRSAAFTVLSFLNTTKYPPSLLFLLMTLGPIMLFLRAVDGGTPRWLCPALVFGKVPMLYFLLHIPLIHLLAVAVCFARYGHVYWMFQSPDIRSFPFTPPPGWGYSLPVVYFMWLIVVLTLYPLCRWFAGVRQRRSDWWLSYF